VIVLNQKGFDCFPPVLPRRYLPGGSKRPRGIAVNRIREGRTQPNTECVSKELANPPGKERG
jgi:hypothetical protein